MDAPSAYHHPPGRRRPSLRRALPLLGAMVAASAVMWALCAVGLLFYTRDARAPETHRLVIPAGTSERIAAGENPLALPAAWSFRADDTLELVNQDGVDHWIGTFFVAAGTTAAYPLKVSYNGSHLLCTLHPAKAIVIDVESRTFDWRLTILPTLAFGPLIGLILAGVARVVRNLDDGGPTGSPDPTDPAPTRQGASS